MILKFSNEKSSEQKRGEGDVMARRTSYHYGRSYTCMQMLWCFFLMKMTQRNRKKLRLPFQLSRKYKNDEGKLA